MIQVRCVNSSLWQSLTASCLEPHIIHAAKQSFAIPDPDRSAPIFEKTRDRTLCQAVAQAIVADDAIADLRHTAGSSEPHPQRAVTSDVQRAHRPLWNLFYAKNMRRDEADTIETKQACVTPHPQIAIRVQSERENSARWQTVAWTP